MANDIELIWVSKDIAKAYEAAETEEVKRDIIMKVIDDKKLDFKTEMEQLNEQALIFQGVCLMHKTRLKEAYNAQLVELEKLWEEFGDIRGQLKNQSKAFADDLAESTNAIKGMSNAVSQLKKDLDSLHIYGSDKLLELSKNVANMDDATRDILNFVVTTYRRPDKQG